MLSPHNDFPGLDVVLMWAHCILIDTSVITFVFDIAVCYDEWFWWLVFSVMRRLYMSRLMDTKKILMLRRHFLSHLIVLYFAKPFQITNQPCGEKCSLVIGLSNHCAICFCFLSSWRSIMLHVFLLSSFVLITRDEKFFIPQQRIGRDDPANLPYLWFVTKYKRFVGR